MDERRGETVALNMAMQIVLVEDHFTIGRLLVNILRKQGFSNVLQADNGEIAWNILNESPVDLVIADWSMPVMDGMELLTKIRQGEKTKDIPVLIMTAKSREEDVREAMDRGASSYIVKPFTPDIVRKKMQEIFAGGMQM